MKRQGARLPRPAAARQQKPEQYDAPLGRPRGVSPQVRPPDDWGHELARNTPAKGRVPFMVK